MSLRYESIESLSQMIQNKTIKPSELIEDTFVNIEKDDTVINSFLALDKEAALEKAKTMDNETPSGKLFGIPMGIKDNIVTKDVETTCASKILEGFNSVYDATVMNKLNAENGILVGKLNMDEFAMGGSTENSFYKKTVNPFDHKAVPGGSSGGSAAAVAASLVPFSLGSDTGGSIRQPASYCGVVGMKPTYGRVSRFGLVAFASSLDQIGPITRNVKDNATVLEVISGLDPHDSTSAPVDNVDFTSQIDKDIKGLRVAVPKEYLGEGVSEEVKASVQAAIKALEKMGATVEEVSLPNSKYGVATYYILSSSEASANLARFDGIRYGYQAEGAQNLEELYKKTRQEGFGDEVKRRIMLGTYALSSGYYDAYYKKAQKVRTLIKQDFERVFENYDIIVGPTAPTTAFDIGAQINDPLTMYANDILTIPINLAGLPSMSIPCGESNGRPIGLQLIGKPFDEKTLYNVAYNYEQIFNMHERYQSL
ncbi:Asp-tRNA(Asn)/Glu-tRNA(Gln) amidotransferase subunit GatA [Macrococcoides caseolyticum]|uniref:Asp-tRNA(Asn)/Glu-tRNA(Gln) amidotransferase subunit GatA n=1 Tax=Macrococcoides caseolyticum TaxID=69966 RepID=UPI000C32F9DE|nr:Asp-tRNA(Asn)/Glu-tRNA(Gln) amidotransferase subunit GatA [Macrococcus caseolyticus]MDJ1089762.1 Asp-tRNA(Asn)/Glu-tRNA(Gln) amidotransferase subunit GatA [Macrococcus caseolyticus]MDJ1091887.1 Asp-tRNA(Asn)/Glu-tRNA(Gln) amidotransferase subunit GatA [Macrococcus caseolyticus]PKE11649.1 Asp-tRNA(Asn)/Glu-tRNA(Gln) amidotransferase GatCAB subunit A [Macrococcus caseolyticus]PKE47068.1 Asp-tRNA(Asn)/Glu-tRNA(Gln) amidotransferase GatCAB subunit A [Macrococcus caseolyticus]PKE61183.1 Asp-tRNA